MSDVASPNVPVPDAQPSSSLRRELAALVALALPLAAVQLGNHLMGFVDVLYAGRLGKIGLAGTGIGNGIYFAVSVVGIGIVLGLDPLASQAFGAGRPRHARQSMWQGLYTAALVTLPLCVLIIGLSLSLERFGVVPEAAQTARTYVFARLPSLVLLLWAVALRSYLQAAHVGFPILLATVLANLANAAAGWALAFGDAGLVRLGLPALGLPALGVRGLGLAATAASGTQLALFALVVRFVPVGAGDEPVRRFDAAAVRRILVLGTPIGLMMAAETGVFALAQVLIGGMAVYASGAHQVALQYASLTFSVCIGIGAATSVQVGRAVGAGDEAATRRAGLMGIGLGASFMALAGVVIAAAPGVLARFVTLEPEVVPMAVTLLRIAAVFQLFDGIQAVSAGALRGAGDTTWAFAANVVAHWIIGLPVGLALGYAAHMGAPGLWWGLTTGLIAVALALAGKFVVLSRGRIAAL